MPDQIAYLKRAAAALLALAGCAAPSSPEAAPAERTEAAAPVPRADEAADQAADEAADRDPASLAGTRWVLREAGGRPVPPQPPATLSFEANRFGGHGGCNNYGGRYRIEGRRIVVEEVASTLIGCGGPVGDKEQLLFRGIGGAFEIAHRPGRSLTVLRDGRAALLFAPAR